MDKLRAKKPLVSAKAKVLRFLSRREYAQEELRAKLLSAGYDLTEIEEAVEWAKARSFQSDDRFALSLHRRRAARFGDKAIESELSVLGLKGRLAELKEDDASDPGSLSSSAESPFLNKADLVPEPERAFQWMQRKYSAALFALYSDGAPDKNALYTLKGKAFQALGQRGFEIRNIDVAWRRLIIEFNSDQ